MLFNFFLSNHLSGGLKGMPDLLLPIFRGLVEAGHEVIGYGFNLRPAPAINVFVEFFPDDSFVATLTGIKAAQGSRFRFGVICTEDLDDALVMQQPEYPGRRRNLERVLAAADFVWTLLPQVEQYERLAGPGKVALLQYGFTESMLNPLLTSDPAFRDIDVLMYGNGTPYRMAVIEELQRRGFQCFVTDRQGLPEFVADDLIGRAKLVLDLRRGPGVRFPSPTRICKALHAGVRVIAEDLGDSPIAGLYRYTERCPYGILADRCGHALREKTFVTDGLAALAAFRTETSMSRNLAAAMKLPIFEELA